MYKNILIASDGSELSAAPDGGFRLAGRGGEILKPEIARTP